jgi:phosphoenolpyruvate synthase/pyruvate phosphate dikinase
MLQDIDFQTDLAIRRERLAALRERIETAPVSEELETALVAKLEAEFPHQRMRFRSSSNAEDLQGFNGAGLYASHAGELDLGVDDVTQAVRSTWASLWNDRAFEERDYYRIDHRATKMGVLCHHAFQGELANGVAITRNPFRDNSRAYYVNAQLGDVSVVFSEAVPEQFLYYSFNPPEVEYLSHSSLTFGAPVLSPEQIDQLIAALQKIHVHFFQYFAVGLPQGDYGMDVEWKFDQEGNLVIKQARPFLR